MRRASAGGLGVEAVASLWEELASLITMMKPTNLRY